MVKDEIVRKVCPVCGKEVYPQTEEWAYRRIRKHERLFLCSYHCLLTYDKRNGASAKYTTNRGAGKKPLPQRAYELGKEIEKRQDLHLIDFARERGITYKQLLRDYEKYQEYVRGERVYEPK